ncbi:acyl-CoA dehydrogenase family protein [Paractinoplanes globisporus]|uniref:Acyl-CoA dehydrogenase family protein n=1 Tax=Paractinoplanes globisporus TaxID=113565 RepID=A0ABW6WXR2_9ACTN|nr:acyl-CoA dehydrogenase family protein [Actinoplanes globisporus]
MSRYDFTPVLDKIAEGAAAREAGRLLPYAEVEQLREAGFTRLRIPVEYGGLGATLPEFFEQLIALGRADSNLPQLLRGHIGFVESRLVNRDERWLRRVAEGAVFGNAQSELGNQSFFHGTTTLAGGRLNGTKFYSTGSLFADFIHTTAAIDDDRSADVFVPTAAGGVRRLDDWNGFGQRLTGSGTTIFEDVRISAEDVEVFENKRPPRTYVAAVFQLVHLATLAGIGRAAVEEVTAFVKQRPRNLHNPTTAPKDDPLVQETVGRVAGAAFAAAATTLAAASAVEKVARLGGSASPADFDAADAAVYSAQGPVINLVLGLVTELFEVGGSSAVTTRYALDRHWRNARTLASHNPLIYRYRSVGDHVLNGTTLAYFGKGEE